MKNRTQQDSEMLREFGILFGQVVGLPAGQPLPERLRRLVGKTRTCPVVTVKSPAEEIDG